MRRKTAAAVMDLVTAAAFLFVCTDVYDPVKATVTDYRNWPEVTEIEISTAPSWTLACNVTVKATGSKSEMPTGPETPETPQTGDDFNVTVCVVTLLGSAAGLAALLLLKGKRRYIGKYVR